MNKPQRDDSKYLFAFALIPEIGSARFGKLKNAFGNFSAAWKATSTQLEKAKIDKKTIKVLCEKRLAIDPDKEYDKFLQNEIVMLRSDRGELPKQLQQIKTAPFVLFCLGNIDLLKKKQLAIVGTRNPTRYGQIATEKLATDISNAGLVITSGMAQGIDSFAHQATMEAENKTIAVLGGGISKVAQAAVPKQMIEKIVAHDGLIISEYQPSFDANKFTFPARNRIISGLSLGVLVVEAGEKSGSLITARYALEQNREVMAIPGSIFSKQSLGTNWLLKEGAQVVRNSKDILGTFNFNTPEKTELEKRSFEDETQQKIFNQLSFEPIHIDQIAKKCRISSSLAATKLSLLELNGAVKNLGGSMFIRQ